MSKIWICQNKTANSPFFCKEGNLNLYSFEELCYYLYQNAEVLDKNFPDESLLNWMEEELLLIELCAQLREGIRQGKGSVWCLGKLLWESGYYTKGELESIQKTVLKIMQAEPEERGKLRADRLLADGRYKSAAGEYQQILRMEHLNTQLETRVWHNLGTAYARQFLFARAAECYEKAYTLGRLDESRQQYLLALSCAEGNSPEVDIRSLEELHQIKEKEGFAHYEAELYRKLEQMAEEYMRNE